MTRECPDPFLAPTATESQTARERPQIPVQHHLLAPHRIYQRAEVVSYVSVEGP